MEAKINVKEFDRSHDNLRWFVKKHHSFENLPTQQFWKTFYLHIFTCSQVYYFLLHIVYVYTMLKSKILFWKNQEILLGNTNKVHESKKKLLT